MSIMPVPRSLDTWRQQGAVLIKIRRMSRVSTVGAVIMMIAMALLTAGPATAAPTGAPPLVSYSQPTQGDVSSMGVGVGSWVDTFRNTYQCPFSFCNLGDAFPGDDLANVCYHWVNGQYWDLVYNRYGGRHTGFILEANLGAGSPRSTQPCSSVGYAATVVVGLATMYQCPMDQCNRGEARPGDDVAAICYQPDGVDNWVWAFNHSNLHVGFVWMSNLKPSTKLSRC